MRIAQPTGRWLPALAAAFLLTAATSPLLEAQSRPRVAVIPFQNETGWWGRDLGNSAASQLTTELVGSGEFAAVVGQLAAGEHRPRQQLHRNTGPSAGADRGFDGGQGLARTPACAPEAPPHFMSTNRQAS